jgi:hypothetical protein
MGFFDRGKAPASKASSSKPGNEGKGNARDGYPFGSTTPGYIDYRDPSVNGAFYPGTTRQRYQDDPNARKVHTPGSDRHSQEEKYFGREIGGVGPAGPPVEWNSGFYDQQHAGDVQRKRELLAGNDPYQKAKAAGDLKGQLAAMQALRSQLMKGRFLDQGGSEETWANRFSPDANWPVPKSPLGIASHGPGRPDFPDAATMAQNGGASSGANEIQGWLGDGTASPDAAPTPRQGMPDWAKAQGGPSDVLAALSRIQSMPIGAPTAATGSPGGFARAASGIAPAMSAAVKKPTIVRRGGGVVTRA